MKNAIILEAWYSKPSSNWYPWLKKELEKKGFEVNIPDLPTMQTNTPSLGKQLKFVLRNCYIDKDTYIFGHSLGTLLAMRIGEIISFRKMFLIAGWDFNDLTKEHRLFWKDDIHHLRIKKNVKEIYCISSDNDPYITAFHVEEMSKRLEGKFVLIKGMGHFGEKEKTKKIPKLLEYL